jgi:tricorn protease-like protein
MDHPGERRDSDARDPARDWNPVWSPDGKYLYFVSDRSGSCSILAALDLHEGHVTARVERRHRSREFIALLKDHYLTELQRHAQELAAKPAEWMPWNYRETLAHVGV